MHCIAHLLACLALVSHGHRVQSSTVHLESSSRSQPLIEANQSSRQEGGGVTLGQWRTLAMLLLSLNPRAAFHSPGPVVHSPMGNAVPVVTLADLHHVASDRWAGRVHTVPLMMSDEATPAAGDALDPGESEPDVFRRIAYRRRTARDYDEMRDVPDDVMSDILATAQRAPTGYNMQPYKIIVCRDPRKREELSKAFVGDGNIRRVSKAPVTIIFLADLEPARLIPRIVDLSREQGLPDDFLMSLSVNVFALTAPGRFGPPTPLNLATTLVSPLAALPVFNDVEAWSFKNAMLVASQMMLAASSHGVSSSPMEGFDTRRLFQTLKVPFTEWPRYAIPLAISMGYDVDSEKGSASLRLPPEEIYFKDDFGTTYEGIKSM